jgi:C4-dicarboxylate transporter
MNSSVVIIRRNIFTFGVRRDNHQRDVKELISKSNELTINSLILAEKAQTLALTIEQMRVITTFTKRILDVKEKLLSHKHTRKDD